ncbi:MAG: hypothetical protein JXR68_02575 [Bacteroidales bacterium]|nr:hypothetical protein [Bacteroidales bacterium]
MKGLIKLKCETCENYEKERNFETKNCFLALDVFWKDIVNTEIYLQQIPQLFNYYTIDIVGPQNIDLEKNISVFYVDASAFYNGFENETEILSIRFCLCEVKKIVYKSEFKASLLIQIIKMRSLSDIFSLDLSLNEGFCGMIEEKDQRYVEIKDFNNYLIKGINFQGDVGVNYIISKNKNRIIAVNSWDFHSNNWFLCNVEYE